MSYGFKCETCTRCFNSDYSRSQHMDALNHWATRYECDFCTAVFLDQDHCEYHMDNFGHHRYDCETCNRNFSSTNAANQHMDAMGHWTNYCSECERKFDNANNLRMHMRSRTHQGANVPCPFCHRGFTTASGVSHHLETGSCPNTQNVNRETIFKALRQRDPNGMITNNLLEWHGESWSANQAWNGRGFECYICHRQFSQHLDLDKHLNSPTHQQAIYHCPNKVRCGSQFKTLAAMFNHLESESCGFIKFAGVNQSVGNFLSTGQKTIGFY